AMPGACRALVDQAEEAPAAATLLSAFVGQVVDHLVRSTLMPAAPITAIARATRRRPLPQPTFDSVHDQWLHALRSPAGAMAENPTELRSLADQMREWRLPLALSAASPFRLSFRLEEPPTNGKGNGRIHIPSAPWQVRYLLQAADDPSLLVPVEQAWT